MMGKKEKNKQTNLEYYPKAYSSVDQKLPDLGNAWTKDPRTELGL